jgi:hypothetical protein
MPDKIADIEIVLAVLESGHSVELPATGYSMYPALKPGYKVTVAPFDEKKAVAGNVVICKSDSLVMHRLIKITTDDSYKTVYITRGDCRKDNDIPWPMGSIVGVATSYKKDGKVYPVKSFLPGKLYYVANFWLLWIDLKLRKWVCGMRLAVRGEHVM